MSHFERIVFKPNPDTFELAVDEIKSFIQSYRSQLSGLTTWIKDNPQAKIAQWEKINEKTLASIYPGNTVNLKMTTNPLLLGNGSKFTVEPAQQIITWTNTNSVYSKDCLLFLDTIQNYKLWQPGSYAIHQTGKGSEKQLKTYGWKNINYQKWFKKSSKI